MPCDEHETLDYCPFCIQEEIENTQKSKTIKFRVNYTRSNGKRASFDCSASNEIDAIVKLEKNRSNYNETLLQLSNISIKLSPQK